MSPSDSCLFCKIILKKTPAKIVYEDSSTIAFEDINPQAPVHVLIVPKTHHADIHSMSENDENAIGHLFLVAKTIAAEKGLEKGYRMVINNGRDAGQTVFHLHLHLLSGRAFAWPPG